MKTYSDLIKHTYGLLPEEFEVINGELYFQGIRLLDYIEKYEAPLKLSYLPNIAENIAKAHQWFNYAFEINQYSGSYTYAFCTKASHFKFILEKTLRCGAHVETSSEYDIPIVEKLFASGDLTKQTYIICNGFKRPGYINRIVQLINEDYNCIPVLDNIHEFDGYAETCKKEFNLGVRVATNEVPEYNYYSSRLGIRSDDILPLLRKKVKNHPLAKVKMIHFFMNTGLKDNIHFWSELNRMVKVYCEVKREFDSLDTLNLGGGLPIKSSLQFDYDYQFMISEIVSAIKEECDEQGIEHPNLVTEFGTFTVGESGAVLYTILDEKKQNDQEQWYIINGSFITHLPDAWGINHKYILLPLNGWDNEFQQVNLGGLTCDGMDYYNSEAHSEQLFLPKIKPNEDLHIGFFHTGAYQEALGGYGGIQHCLIPSPKHLVIDNDDTGQLKSNLVSDVQGVDSMLNILGY